MTAVTSVSAVSRISTRYRSGLTLSGALRDWFAFASFFAFSTME